MITLNDFQDIDAEIIPHVLTGLDQTDEGLRFILDGTAYVLRNNGVSMWLDLSPDSPAIIEPVAVFLQEYWDNDPFGQYPSIAISELSDRSHLVLCSLGVDGLCITIY